IALRRQSVMNANNQALAHSTSDFYQLIAMSLYNPTTELAEAFLNGNYKEDVLAILNELACDEDELAEIKRAFQDIEGNLKDEETLLQDMRIENTRLFYDPKKPVLSIHETTFLSDQKNEKEKPLL